MEPTELCLQCRARAGLALDSCERREDYSQFETRGIPSGHYIAGRYRVRDLEGLSSRGRLAYLLATLDEIQGEEK